MGTWGTDTFQNDWALDWLAGLRKSGDASQVRVALGRVVEHGGTRHFPPSIFARLIGRRGRTNWLRANVASQALAAAEVVAAWHGHPTATLPDGLLAYLRQHASLFRPEFVALALKAVSIVKTNSELKDLWEEGDPTKWKNVVEDLERRLGLPADTTGLIR